MRYLVHHLLTESAERDPGGEAIVDGDTRLDFAGAAQRVTAGAEQLQSLGIARGDRVCVYMKPGCDLPIALLSISMAGGVFVPIHHSLLAGQVEHILRDSGARALLSDVNRLGNLPDDISNLPDLKFIAAHGAHENRLAGLPLYPIAQNTSAVARPKIPSIGKDLAALLYTSGSTGLPKGVMLSHANVLAGAEIVADYLRLSSADRLLAALPLSFDAGLNQLTTSMLVGATAVMIDFRFGRDISKRLAEENITGLAGVPPLWSLLAQPSSGLGARALPHLRYITNTGGAMPQNILRQLQGLLPSTNIYLMYGLTEAFRSTYLPPEELKRRPTSMGRSIPNTEILVVSEDGKLCAPGEVGELVHHGPTVSMGYWGRPEATAKVLRPHPSAQSGQGSTDLVCYSGDLVRQDEDGYFYFVGRRDNQIKSAGFRISPTEVENAICQAAPIRQAAVIGVPDAMLGQHLVAFVVPQEGRADLRPATVLEALAPVLPRHMLPKQIRIVEALPTTSSGKVAYPALKQLLNEEDAAAETSLGVA
ncbi:MAG: AMP-binding protein [Rhizobiaceae bacterium]|nr:AMP-binding protein [Rhizobiaceae bacterium]